MVIKIFLLHGTQGFEHLFSYPIDCKESKPLGMENGAISDDQITASSIWNSESRASNGRLNLIATGHSRTGSWMSKTKDRNQWLQVDFQRSVIITGISTQGRQEVNQFVKVIRFLLAMMEKTLMVLESEKYSR